MSMSAGRGGSLVCRRSREPRAASPRVASVPPAGPAEELGFVDDLAPELHGLVVLRTGALPRHHEVGSLLNARGHSSARPLRASRRLIAAESIETPRQHDRLAGERARPGFELVPLVGNAYACRTELLDEF